MEDKTRLSEHTADTILSMITVEQRFTPGEKLPNENELSKELQVSRTTLREAIRILVTAGVLEICRGKGTFVKEHLPKDGGRELTGIQSDRINMKDLYEMRLIFEPEAAYYAALRASDAEIGRIEKLGAEIEQKIRTGEDRTQVEQAFHKSIAKATHNEFMKQLMPVIYQGINQGVRLSWENEQVLADTLNDHHMIVDFIKSRNPQGARDAMRIHILHAMERLPME